MDESLEDQVNAAFAKKSKARDRFIGLYRELYGADGPTSDVLRKELSRCKREEEEADYEIERLRLVIQARLADRK